MNFALGMLTILALAAAWTAVLRWAFAPRELDEIDDNEHARMVRSLRGGRHG